MVDRLLVNIIDDQLCSIYNESQDLEKSSQVAQSLIQLGMPDSVVKVGFLRLAFIKDILPKTLEETLLEDERSMLLDLDKIKIVDQLHEIKQQNIESLRQMLLAMVKDIRVVVIKLAFRLIEMRTIATYPADKQRQLALQTKDIFAPLANRLGIFKLKWELEDLALRTLEPTTYKLISSSLLEQRKTREKYIEQVVATLKELVKKEGVDEIAVYGRAKHINSIYSKMKKKQKKLEEIYDLLALRVQVETIEDCYKVLSVVHSVWENIASEFDDYIANPKPNGYQSLHTAVIGPLGKTIEIQIRTNEMHQYAELGVAAHWRYKENSSGKTSSFDRQINWLRHLLEEPDDTIVDEFATEIVEDRIYVITPQGQVVDLPYQATPLDFAYQIHTDLGHRTRGAIVNGVMTTLTYTLKTGDQVEVLTGSKAQPSRDWLNASQGYLVSARARGKVRRYFKQLEKDKATSEGRELFDKTIEKTSLKVSDEKLLQAAKKFNHKNIEDLYAAIGFGDVSILQVIRYLEDICEDKKHQVTDDIETRLARIPTRSRQSDRGSVIVEGINDLLISIATCCSPVAPDQITGFITKAKGVSIHRSSCRNLKALAKSEPDKLIKADWNDNRVGFSTTIGIQAIDRVGLIRDISQALLNEGAIIHHTTFTSDEDEMVAMKMQISVKNIDHLNRVLDRVRVVKTIQSVRRLVK